MRKKVDKVCYMFGEGSGNETKLFRFIEDSDKFKKKYSTWSLEYGSAAGGSCAVILDKCISEVRGKVYSLVLCFMDTDVLIDKEKMKKMKKKFNAKEEMLKLEEKAESNTPKIKIIWQEINIEDELYKIIGRKTRKSKFKETINNNKALVINSPFLKRVFTLFF